MKSEDSASDLIHRTSEDLPVVGMLLKGNHRREEAERELDDVRRWMELAQEAGGVATYQMDIPTNSLWWSRSVYALYGLEQSDASPSLDIWLSSIHPDDRPAVERAAVAAIEQGSEIDHQFRVVLPHSGKVRWIHDRGKVDRDADGTPLRLHGVNVDITALREVQEQLAQSEERFRRTFEHANVGVTHVDIEGRFLRVNDRLCQLLGRSPAELTSLTFQDITYPEDLGTDLEQLDSLIAGEIDCYTMEKRYIRPDGSLIWADLSVALLRDCSGNPIHLVSIISDIHQRKQAEEQLQLVLGEANHRVKNLLTVVGAVVRSSARTAENATDLADKISGRLAGIAASHDLLVGKSVDGGDLEQLIQRQLEIFAGSARRRVVLEGPAVHLGPKAVQAFGMVLHELATNACKYGALSQDKGRVHVTWVIDEDRDRLSFAWVEKDGPEVKPTERKGFGLRTMQRMLTNTLGGEAEHHLLPRGALFRATLPLCNARAG